MAPPEAEEVFSVDQGNGDLALRVPLVGKAGKTFTLSVEAVDRNGDPGGLSGSIQVVIHVLDSNNLLTLVFADNVENITKNLQNITRLAG